VRRKSERLVKSRTGWRKADQVKKIKIVMTVISVTLCISIAVGAALVWVEVKHPFSAASSSSIKTGLAVVSSSQSEVLPTYDDSYNLIVVNSMNPLDPDFSVTLVKYDQILVDEKIVPALKKMMLDAKAAGCALKLTGGYVDAKAQDKLFQAEVQKLIKNGKYSQIRAENQALSTVGRSGYNENQSGMAVNFSAEGVGSNVNFSTTNQYKWLIKNCVSYGFVLRYPADKAEVTGMTFLPAHFRYVGVNSAIKMREYSMCLEEYAAYVKKQTAN